MAFRNAPLLKPRVEAVLPKKEREKARIQRERRENSKKHKAKVLLEESKQQGAAADVSAKSPSGTVLQDKQSTATTVRFNSDDTEHGPVKSPDASSLENPFASLTIVEDGTSSQYEQLDFCPECYVPLAPDPPADKLYIFLHALRYTTPWGAFETEMPEWAEPGWTWQESKEDTSPAVF